MQALKHLETKKTETVLLRVRPSAHRIAKRLARHEDLPMSIVVSNLIQRRWDRLQSKNNLRD